MGLQWQGTGIARSTAARAAHRTHADGHLLKGNLIDERISRAVGWQGTQHRVDGRTRSRAGASAAAGLTVCVNTGEVLVRKLVSPPYTAVIASEPTGSVLDLNVALPYLLSVPVPIAFEPL